MGFARDLEFGLRYAPGEATWWGARAILDRRWVPAKSKRRSSLDFLFDRQSWAGAGLEMQKLMDALNKGEALAKYRRAWERDLVPESWTPEEGISVYTVGGVVFYGSENASHGYWYVAARLATPEDKARPKAGHVIWRAKP